MITKNHTSAAFPLAGGRGQKIATHSTVSASYFDQTLIFLLITHLALHVLPRTTLTLEPLTRKLSENPASDRN